MISRQFVMRLVQTVVVLALGLLMYTTDAQADRVFESFTCPDQGCGYCPAEWHGSCITGSVPCSEFGCSDDGECEEGGNTYTQCYCPPCEGN